MLSATAARRLGTGHASPDTQVLVDGTWCTVVGILQPSVLTRELDTPAVSPTRTPPCDRALTGHTYAGTAQHLPYVLRQHRVPARADIRRARQDTLGAGLGHAGPEELLAERQLAAATGYYDQSHMTATSAR
ncbi:hypothetical protein [Streptomyces sp. NBC_00996]|uniref:hypothetical protein n=1 Tax=Streptomyces sp. NBC_00996 TaxID=2903710 RepID=UPI0038682A9F